VKRGASCALTVAVACSALTAPLSAAPSFVPTPPAQANYMLNCMGCHLADGSGAQGKVPSLRDSLALLSASRAGRRYLVQVPGSAQSPLSNLELAQVLNWMVRNLSPRGVADGFTEFTAVEVADYRRLTLVSVRDTRARLLSPAADRAPR
jgi:cytochrome c553